MLLKYNVRGVSVGDEGESENVVVIWDALDGSEADNEGHKEALEDLDITDDDIYHSELFERFCRKFVGNMEVLEGVFGSDLESDY